MNKPICTVMAGLPATGKSTRVREMSTMDPDVFVYSTDSILERVAEQLGKTYNDVFEDNIRNAKQEADVLLASAIKHRLNIIWDQTNLGVGKRRSIINLMKRSGYAVNCECIMPPEAGWISDQKVWAYRLRNREGKTIPEHVLSNMIESFVIPTIEEGFDEITFFNMHGALMTVQYDNS